MKNRNGKNTYWEAERNGEVTFHTNIQEPERKVKTRKGWRFKRLKEDPHTSGRYNEAQRMRGYRSTSPTGRSNTSRPEMQPRPFTTFHMPRGMDVNDLIMGVPPMKNNADDLLGILGMMSGMMRENVVHTMNLADLDFSDIEKRVMSHVILDESGFIKSNQMRSNKEEDDIINKIIEGEATRIKEE